MTAPATRWVALSELRVWDKNPRKNEAAIPKVAASIRRFGFVAPVVVWADEGRLVAGHTRSAALESILRDEPGFVPPGAPEGTTPGFVPVVFHPFASEADANAYAIADNRLNELAEWDRDALDDVLRGLDPVTVDVVGFDPAALVTEDLGFLDAFGSKPETAEIAGEARPEGERGSAAFRTLVLTLSPEHEERVLATLHRIARENGLPSRDTAVAWLCDRFEHGG